VLEVSRTFPDSHTDIKILGHTYSLAGYHI